MEKGLKLKFRKFFGLIPAFVEVTGEKLVGGAFSLPLRESGTGILLRFLRNFLKTSFL